MYCTADSVIGWCRPLYGTPCRVDAELEFCAKSKISVHCAALQLRASSAVCPVLRVYSCAFLPSPPLFSSSNGLSTWRAKRYCFISSWQSRVQSQSRFIDSDPAAVPPHSVLFRLVCWSAPQGRKKSKSQNLPQNISSIPYFRIISAHVLLRHEIYYTQS